MFGIISIFKTISDEKDCRRLSFTDSELKSRPFYPIRSKRITIGSADSDDIRVYDHSLPHDFQMELIISDQNTNQRNEFFVRLLKGKPFQLNGEPVLIHCRKVELRNKDEITIGTNTLVVNKCKPLTKTLSPIENNENNSNNNNNNCKQTLNQVLDSTVGTHVRKTREKRVTKTPKRVTRQTRQTARQQSVPFIVDTQISEKQVIESSENTITKKSVTKTVTRNTRQTAGQQSVPFIVDTKIVKKQDFESSENTTTEKGVTKRQKRLKQTVEKSDRVLRPKEKSDRVLRPKQKNK